MHKHDVNKRILRRVHQTKPGRPVEARAIVWGGILMFFGTGIPLGLRRGEPLDDGRAGTLADARASLGAWFLVGDVLRQRT